MGESLVVGVRAPLDLAGLGVSLAEDELGLLSRLVSHLGGCLLGGDESRPQERLELAETDEIGFELLDLVGEVGALAPDVLEARGDILEQLVGRCDAVAAEVRAGRRDVSDLDGCEGHGCLSP